MKENIKIAISGKSGCGNTTVSKMLADRLGLQFINFTFRTLAEERGVDLKTILDEASKNDSIDREVDFRQVELAQKSGGCVLGSRLSIWMLKEADFKVFLDASPIVRAKRITGREGGNLDEVAAFTAERDRQDHERYTRIYNIDMNNYQFVDLVVDTDNINPQQITDLIINKINQKYNKLPKN